MTKILFEDIKAIQKFNIYMQYFNIQSYKF